MKRREFITLLGGAGRVAARGASAAVGDAGDWLQSLAKLSCQVENHRGRS